MKIQVKDLKPNPFRNLKKYPIDREKVETLKKTIQETTFWDNIMARKINGHYEIPAGHHRLVALKELGINEIDIPIRDLSDAMMIKIMAYDNIQDWENRPIVIIETVRVARDFLSSELIKYKTWEEFRSDKFIRPIIKSEPEFRTIYGKLKKGEKIGREIIKNFLGSYKQWMIQEALATLNDQEIYDDNIQGIFQDMRQLTEFRQGINKINKEREEEGLPEYTKEEIIDLAKKTKERKENLWEKRKPAKREKLKNPKKEIETIIRQELGGDEAVFDAEIKDLIIEINKANYNAEQLHREILSINTAIKNMDTVSISGNKLVFESLTCFSELFLSYTAMMNCFGIDFKNEIKKLKNG